VSEGIYFKIENRDFYVNQNMNSNYFQVESMPHPYKVSLNEKDEPIELINKLIAKNERDILLIDENVYNLYCKNLKFPQNRIFKLSAIEENKTISEVVKLIEFLQNRDFTKGENLIVVGGGITQDIGGFVGACYKRGINWTFVPTTLLSMCDSCIGGKIGINHNNAKNQLALFSSPYEVIINPKFLNTLSEKEVKSGLGEILKLHIMAGRKTVDFYLGYMSKNKLSGLDYKKLILSALSIKKSIIEVDEFESYYRKALNYGHTFGHAIEVLSEYAIPHGQAVIVGMIIANEFSYKYKLINLNEKQELFELGNQLIESSSFKMVSGKGILELLKKDKKARGNIIDIVLIESFGSMKLFPIRLDSSLEEMVMEVIGRLYIKIES